MLNKEYSFLVDKQLFQKLNLVTQDKNRHVKVYLPNREIESFRISIIPFNIKDINEYYKLYSDSKVMEKYCDGNTRSKYEVDQLMSDYMGAQEPSYFSIFDKDTLSFIGTIFLTTRKQNEGEILLGYLINKNYWGNNYAKEALYSLLFCLFPLARKDITVITATTRGDNTASQNILENFNFKRIEEVEKFGQKRLLYKLDAKKVKEIHKNIKIHDLSLIKKNLGTVFLSYSELLENSFLYKYFLNDIISPLLPNNASSQIDKLLSYLPHKNSYWISIHFTLSSLGYFLLSEQKHSFYIKFTLPIINTIGYSSKLLISEIYQKLAHERTKNVIMNDNANNNPNYFDDCIYEVTLITSLSILFSIPAALSFSSVGTPAYIAFSTLSSFSSSTLTCVASNKQIISPNTHSLSAKLIPYLIDSFVASSVINTLVFNSFYSLPEVAINIKKISFILSSVVFADQIAKAAIEISPNSFFESIDSFFSFVYLNPQSEISEDFDVF